jgi:RimJ/RimL family protein N-acetyltransferase
MNTPIETERLLLKELDGEDFPFIIALLNSPGWLKYIGDRGVKTKDEAMGYLKNGPLKSYEENGFGLYKVMLKDIGTPIGLCGLLKRDSLEHPDLGFAFLAEYMGKGYAFEAAKKVLEFSRESLNITIFQAITLPDNVSSIRLLQKLGFLYLSPFRFLEGEELQLFQIILKEDH